MTSSDVLLTEIPKETRKLTWRVADFATIRPCQKLVTAVKVEIKMGDKLGFPVTLWAKLAWFKEAEVNWISFYFHLKSQHNAGEPVIISAKIKVEKSGIPITKQFEPHDMNVGNLPTDRTWGFQKLIPSTEPLSNLPLAADGSLPIEMEVTLFDTRESQVMRPTPLTLSAILARFESRFAAQLKQDLENMVKNPVVSASGPATWIKVISRDGTKISANSSILAARSPVFRTMFETPMSEVKKGVVKIQDIGGNALDVFLHFLQTGVLREEWKEPETVEELTFAAHKYLIQDLLEFLDEALGQVCSPEQCSNMIRLAHRLELKKAEKALLKMRQDQWTQATDAEEMIALFHE